MTEAAFPGEGTEGTEVETGTPDLGAQTDTGTPAEYDKGDIEARLRNEPDFAVAQYKEVQAALSRAQQKTRGADLALKAVEELGGGEVGSQAVYSHLAEYSKVLGDPQLRKIIEGWRQTGRVPDDYGDLESDDEMTPERQELDGLRQTVARLEGKTARTEMKGHLVGFFGSDFGKALTREEQGELMRELDGKFSAWEATPAGRAQLSQVNRDTVEILATDWIRRNGKLGEIGERIHLQKLNAKRGLSTDGPSGISSSASRADTSKMSVRDAMADFAREMGVDLSKPVR